MKLSDFKEEVRARADTVKVAAALGIEVAKKGKVWVGFCPFHSEKSGSFTIFPDERFHCFGCGADGDVFDLVTKRHGGEFREAVEFVASITGLAIPEWTPSSPKDREEREKAADLLRVAATYWHEMLIGHAKADAHRDYLRGRGFGEEAWRLWGAGAAGGQNGLLAHLKAGNHDLALAAKIGLLRGEAGKYRDMFRDRIMLPFWAGGRVTYVTGRAVRPDTEPKYLHLPNSEFARKRIYGNARERALIVVEGPFDVWAVDAMSPPGVGAVAIMGLGSDPTLAKAMTGRDTVYVALDDDRAGQAKVDTLAGQAGHARAKILSWSPYKDAAEYLVATNGADFEERLRGAPTWAEWTLTVIEAATEKVPLAEAAIKAATGLTIAGRDAFVVGLKRVMKGVLTPKAITAMMAEALPKEQAAVAAREEEAYYRVQNGEMWRDHGAKARRITAGGVVTFSEMIRVDDGINRDLVLGVQIALKDGTILTERVAAEDSGDPTIMIKHIRRVAGPRLTIEAGERTHITQAIDAISAGIPEYVEVARTGWVAADGNIAFATPGGVVGTLPEGYRVHLPDDLQSDMTRFAVVDQGDLAFGYAIDGVFNGLLAAFEAKISYPLLAFALMPVAARWMNPQKFAMHLSGETGSLKSETCKIMMSFFGADFRAAAPLMSWRSTINSIEQIGWALPDALALVDDYKPSIVSSWEFTELIHRYADGNARARLSRDSKLRKRQAMRCWLLSNGEDIPTGESSVLARMVTVRLPKRPQGAAYNVALRKAQRLAEYFPTITARWAQWLMVNAEAQGFEARIELYHQKISAVVQEKVPEVPNVNRIAKNVAMLWSCWDALGAWATEVFPEEWRGTAVEAWDNVPSIMMRLALEVAGHVVEEKPTRVFLNTVQEGLDSGRFYLQPRTEKASGRMGLAGYFDKDGIYLLPSMYKEVSKWMRESGQQIGFSNAELYRLLRQDGVLEREGKDGAAMSVRVGLVGSTYSVKALHLKVGTLTTPDGDGGDGGG